MNTYMICFIKSSLQQGLRMVGNGRPTPPDTKQQQFGHFPLPAIRSPQKWLTPTPSILCCSQKPILGCSQKLILGCCIVSLSFHTISPQWTQSLYKATLTTTIVLLMMQTLCQHKRKRGDYSHNNQDQINMIQQNPDGVLKWLRDVVNATDTYLYGIKDYRQTKPIMHTKPHTATSPKQTHNNETHSQRFATVHI